MGNLHLVTGYGGTEHITAEDHGAFNAAVYGSGNFVLPLGNQFAATVVSNNLIRIKDGELLTQGRHIRLASGKYVDLTIQNGTQGYNRVDLIVARYTKDSSTGVEDCNLVVLKGTQTTGTAAAPSITTGNLITGAATTHDVPLYSIPLSGITVGTPVRLTQVTDTSTGHNHDSRYYLREETDALLTKKLDGDTVVDYVVEQSTTSLWKWRKWKSGRKECWKTGTITGTITNNAGGFYYSATQSVMLPFTFTSVDGWQVSGCGTDTSYNIIVRLLGFGDDNDRCNIQAVSLNGDESQASWKYSLYVTGT